MHGLTLEDAALRLTIPKGTLANWVAAAKRGTSPKVALGRRSVSAIGKEIRYLMIRIDSAVSGTIAGTIEGIQRDTEGRAHRSSVPRGQSSRPDQ